MSVRDSVKGAQAPFSISTATVIGSGIAGACAAHALHKRGIAVTVHETHPNIAAEASGNPAGLVMLRLDRGDHPAARFHRQAFDYAVGYYEALGDDGFIARGVSDSLHDTDKRAQLLAANLFPAEDLYEVDGTLFHRRAGSICAPRTIARLLQGCTVKINSQIDDLRAIESDITVIATGRHLAQFTKLNVKYHAGQVDWAPAPTAITACIGSGGYATPADGNIVFGATFERWPDPNHMPPVTAIGSDENKQRLKNLTGLDVGTTQARASLRCATDDRLPVSGHLRDSIYCIGAMGARGLTLAPLLAEMLVADALQQPQPVSHDIWQLVQPHRLLDVGHMQDVG